MHKDRKAQKKLYEMYRVYLYGACMRYANNSMEAEDILQEWFYRILKDLKQFKASSSLKNMNVQSHGQQCFNVHQKT